MNTSSQFSQFTTLWNLWTLLVNFSAQSSQLTSIVGMSFSKSLSQSSIVSQSLYSRLPKAGFTMSSWNFEGVKASGAGGGKSFAPEGEIGDGAFSGED